MPTRPAKHQVSAELATCQSTIARKAHDSLHSDTKHSTSQNRQFMVVVAHRRRLCHQHDCSLHREARSAQTAFTSSPRALRPPQRNERCGLSDVRRLTFGVASLRRCCPARSSRAMQLCLAGSAERVCADFDMQMQLLNEAETHEHHHIEPLAAAPVCEHQSQYTDVQLHSGYRSYREICGTASVQFGRRISSSAGSLRYCSLTRTVAHERAPYTQPPG